jgi:shikimate kinase
MQRADDNTKNIVLTGFMGVRKTTVGKELAKRLEG